MAKITVEEMFPKGWRNEKSLEKHSTPGKQIKTLKEYREKNADLVDVEGRIKNVITFKNANPISNLSKRTTQLDRYRYANAMSHKFTTDAVLSNGKPIRFAGAELKPGVEVFEIVSDGLDPLYDNNYTLNTKQLFSVKFGKVVSEKVEEPEIHSTLQVEPLKK